MESRKKKVVSVSRSILSPPLVPFDRGSDPVSASGHGPLVVSSGRKLKRCLNLILTHDDDLWRPPTVTRRDSKLVFVTFAPLSERQHKLCLPRNEQPTHLVVEKRYEKGRAVSQPALFHIKLFYNLVKRYKAAKMGSISTSMAQDEAEPVRSCLFFIFLFHSASSRSSSSSSHYFWEFYPSCSSFKVL